MNSSPFCSHSMVDLRSILRGRPQAAASIVGSKDHPGISGTVRLYQANEGAIVFAQVSGLPQSDIPCRERVFGFHIHEGTDCSGNMDDPLADAMICSLKGRQGNNKREREERWENESKWI